MYQLALDIKTSAQLLGVNPKILKQSLKQKK
jgi:hypothetical protein